MDAEWPLILFTFFNCLAGGILLVQSVLTLMGKAKRMQFISYVAAFGAMCIGGICVFFHLTHPLNMLNGFGHITSGITIELIFCVLFALIAAVNFLMTWRDEDGIAPKWCCILGILIGVGLPAATGDSYLMPSLPAWDTYLLPLYYVMDTVLLGSVACLIIAAVIKEEEDTVKLIAKFALIGGILVIVASIIYAIYIASTGGDYTEVEYYFDPTLPDIAMRDVGYYTSAILYGHLAVVFWLGCIVVGCAIPAVIGYLVFGGKIGNLFKTGDTPSEGTTEVSGSAVSRTLSSLVSNKVFMYGICGLVCCIIGGLLWRYMLYDVAINALYLFQWAL